MRYPWPPATRTFWQLNPNMGQLLELCEENYCLLLRLAPELPSLQGRIVSCLDGHVSLHLEILEQTPYTSVIHLTHRFMFEGEVHADPDAVLRVYHDARQIEVINLKQSMLPAAGALYHHPSLVNRWKLNIFLSKWFNYCLQQGHVFT